MFFVKGKEPHVQHYLDDFLLISLPASTTAVNELQTCLALCQDLGVPIANDKTAGPTTVLTHLGFELNTIKLELQLPLEKLIYFIYSVLVMAPHLPRLG